jgi:hypothetical protein
VAETCYRDSSGPPVRNRSPGGWGGGGREARACPSFPVWIRYKRDGVRIRVKAKSYPAKISVSIHLGPDSIVMHGFTFRTCFLQTSELINGIWPAKLKYGGKIQPAEVLPPVSKSTFRHQRHTSLSLVNQTRL